MNTPKSLSSFLRLKDFSIRPARGEDVDSLVPIINEAYSYQDEAKGAPRTNESHLRNRMGEVNLYAIERNGEVIGCVYTEQVDDSLHFGLLTLSPKHRGKGIAAAVIEAIEAFARDGGYTSLSLDYMSLAPWLKGYYEKYGFKETGHRTRWGTIDLIRMVKSWN
jgi:ribosomal protein S18 acetylase RimI-like enzyme